jgi:hypothetical protein
VTAEPGDRGRRLRTPPRAGPRNSPRSTPQRVRVTSPRMGAARRPPSRPATREIDEQTGLGEVYMRSLLRAQLRPGITVIAVLALVLGTLPAVFAIEPQLAAVRVVSVPLPWLLIGVGVYPALLAAAWWTVRAAEHAERDFVEIVGRR